MKFFVTVTALAISATGANAASKVPVSSGDQLLNCTAKVLHSEELPFAPEGQWLVKATLEITPPHGDAYTATVQDWTPWQIPPPRRGQTFRLLCDPAHFGDLHLISRQPIRAAF
ncbi:MAG TPA: hypothetical protein VKT76_02515 [Bradyrhizobium sp.]|nr:hypothetical protein [Bradyrhizobium sp.]